MKIPELLAPAGGMESALAAINAGADALYLGGKNFSARSSAQNFTEDEIVSLIEYAALRNVKIYIAVNTVYKNNEMPQVLEFVESMHQEGAAAFILQDTGLAYVLKSQFPQVEIHASTQMSVHSTNGAHFMESMGFSRVVLSRELSLAEVMEINSETNIECEVFIHGALCISYSGQCLMSSLIGGRSGNRGKCAQICRTRYELIKNSCPPLKSGYLLSPKDMMTLDILNNIAATSVSSLKIEGRMKSPEYVYLVTKAYREQLDIIAAGINSPASENTVQSLLQIFNRGGSFSTGYYNNYAGYEMMSTVTPKSSGIFVGEVVAYKNNKCKIKFVKEMNPGDGIEIWTSNGKHTGTGVSQHISANSTFEFTLDGAIENGNKVYKSHDKRLIDAIKKEMATVKKKRVVIGSIEANIGASLKLTLSVGDTTIQKVGDIVEAAQNAPMSTDDIIGQLSKTGDTPFQINFTYVNIDDNVFVSKSVLNKLRREGLGELESAIINEIKREPFCHSSNLIKLQDKPAAKQQKISVQISCASHLQAVITQNISRVYINYTESNIIALPNSKHNTEIFIALPIISRNTTENELKDTIVKLESVQIIDGYLVSTYGQLHILQSIGTKKQIMLNYTFNIFNSLSVQFFNSMGVDVTLSQELNVNEINCMNIQSFELIAYGQQILMSTHNCPVGLYANCRKESNYALKDKTGANFPIITDCHNCIAYVLNSKTLDTCPRFKTLKNTSAEFFRLIFTTEDEKTICGTIARYKEALAGAIVAGEVKDFTYGHFFRGVE